MTWLTLLLKELATAAVRAVTSPRLPADPESPHDVKAARHGAAAGEAARRASREAGTGER
jgi:hypothetical protein